jgi:hypothetical protein
VKDDKRVARSGRGARRIMFSNLGLPHDVPPSYRQRRRCASRYFELVPACEVRLIAVVVYSLRIYLTGSVTVFPVHSAKKLSTSSTG